MKIEEREFIENLFERRLEEVRRKAMADGRVAVQQRRYDRVIDPNGQKRFAIGSASARSYIYCRNDVVRAFSVSHIHDAACDAGAMRSSPAAARDDAHWDTRGHI